MFGKIALFYLIVGTLIGGIAQSLGVDIFVSMFASVVGPAAILVGVGVLRYTGRI